MKKDKQSIFLIVATIITVIIWIGSNLYHIAVTSTVPEDIQETIAPFNPKIDKSIFETIRNKKEVSQFVVAPPVSTTSSSPTNSPTVQPTIINNQATQSAGQ